MARHWLALALYACGAPPAPEHAPPPRPVVIAALPDAPEPVQPTDECTFDRLVTCGPSLSCKLQLPATREDAVDHLRRLSVAETNAARAEHPDACCYVEFVRTACD